MPSWKQALTIAVIAVIAIEVFNRWIRPRVFKA